MSKYIVSPQAQKRLRQIRAYTLKNFGENQKKIYMRMLRDKMRLAANHLGEHRSDIKLGYYSIRAEKHYIYYRIRDTHIDIMDALHESMEPRKHI